MNTLRTADYGFDAVVMDKENHAVALIEVKAHPIEKWAAGLPMQLAKFAERIAFILTIDPNQIYLYRPAGDVLGEPLARLDTREVLQNYDPEFTRKRVFGSYLLTLVEAWLRDLAYHWHSENPPGTAELGKTGLLEMMSEGSTRRLGT